MLEKPVQRINQSQPNTTKQTTQHKQINKQTNNTTQTNKQTTQTNKQTTQTNKQHNTNK